LRLAWVDDPNLMKRQHANSVIGVTSPLRSMTSSQNAKWPDFVT
jgi:hypothetical protein